MSGLDRHGGQDIDSQPGVPTSAVFSLTTGTRAIYLSVRGLSVIRLLGNLGHGGQPRQVHLPLVQQRSVHRRDHRTRVEAAPKYDLALES